MLSKVISSIKVEALNLELCLKLLELKWEGIRMEFFSLYTVFCCFFSFLPSFYLWSNLSLLKPKHAHFNFEVFLSAWSVFPALGFCSTSLIFFFWVMCLTWPEADYILSFCLSHTRHLHPPLGGEQLCDDRCALQDMHLKLSWTGEKKTDFLIVSSYFWVYFLLLLSSYIMTVRHLITNAGYIYFHSKQGIPLKTNYERK